MIPEIKIPVSTVLNCIYSQDKDAVEEWVRENVIPNLEEYQNCAGCTH
jgi:hypothetical protein